MGRRGSMDSLLRNCRFCPRQCGVNREAGELGFCRAGAELRIFSHGPHHGEEPPLSGTGGSGTVFFSRCTLGCIYCQNYPWSQESKGDPYSAEALAKVLIGLAEKGCHNWNLVSPTPWLPLISEALSEARHRGSSLPVVMNTSGYERGEVLQDTRDCADLYLVDLRYASEETGRQGSGVADYVACAHAAIRRMWELAGPLVVDEAGLATRGVICRVLILPGHADEAVRSLEWLADTFGPRMAVSVMSQYVPAHRAAGHAPWNRGITREEYDRVAGVLEQLEFDLGWLQGYGGTVPKELLGYEMEPGGDGQKKRLKLSRELHMMRKTDS